MAGAEAYHRAKFHLDPSNRLVTIHQRDGQDGQPKTTVQTSLNFLYMLGLLVAVARSSSDDSAIRYVLPVLWMASVGANDCKSDHRGHSKVYTQSYIG